MEFDGSGLQTIILSGEVTSADSNVRGIALDLAGEQIFWADNGADRIQRANFDGSSNVILHTIADSSFPAEVFLDPGSQVLYWCDATRKHIERSAFDGTSVMFAVSDAAPSSPYFMEVDRVPLSALGGGVVPMTNGVVAASESMPLQITPATRSQDLLKPSRKPTSFSSKIATPFFTPLIFFVIPKPTSPTASSSLGISHAKFSPLIPLIEKPPNSTGFI